jgi:hypothetical protein
MGDKLWRGDWRRERTFPAAIAYRSDVIASDPGTAYGELIGRLTGAFFAFDC